MIGGGASLVKIIPLLANIAQDIATVATHYKYGTNHLQLKQ